MPRGSFCLIWCIMRLWHTTYYSTTVALHFRPHTHIATTFALQYMKGVEGGMHRKIFRSCIKMSFLWYSTDESVMIVESFWYRPCTVYYSNSTCMQYLQYAYRNFILPLHNVTLKFPVIPENSRFSESSRKIPGNFPTSKNFNLIFLEMVI